MEGCGLELRGRTQAYSDSFSLSLNANTLHDFQLSCAVSNAGGVSCVSHPKGSYSWYPVVILPPHIWLMEIQWSLLGIKPAFILPVLSV